MSNEVKNEAQYPDVNTNPLPEGGKRRLAVALKSLLGIAAIGEMVYYGVSYAEKRNEAEEEDTEEEGTLSCINFLELIPFCIDIANFGISYAVGYYVYAPLDASRVKAGDYAELIKNVSTDSKISSNVWIARTCICFAKDTLSMINTAHAKVKCLKKPINFIMRAIYPILSIVLTMVSCIYEITGICEAAKLDNAKLTEKQKTDKKAFLTENIGFIAGDVTELIDCIIKMSKTKNEWVIVGREVLKFTYPVTMFVEAGLIDNQPS